MSAPLATPLSLVFFLLLSFPPLTLLLSVLPGLIVLERDKGEEGGGG